MFLGPGVNPAQGVFIEMFTTSILVLAVLMMAAEKHQATPFAPVRCTFAIGSIRHLTHGLLGWYWLDALHGPHVSRRPAGLES